jgi:hypothetical protein
MSSGPSNDHFNNSVSGDRSQLNKYFITKFFKSNYSLRQDLIYLNKTRESN